MTTHLIIDTNEGALSENIQTFFIEIDPMAIHKNKKPR